MTRCSVKLHEVMQVLFDSWRDVSEIAAELGVSHESAARRTSMLAAQELVERRRVGVRGPIAWRSRTPRSHIEVRPTELGYAYLGEYVYTEEAA